MGNAESTPVALRVGATGFGAGVGCGVGIGVGAPLSLGGVPALSSATQGISSGLTSVSGALGGLPGAARQRVKALGVAGLDLGVGCGVGLGYGWGAGLMLKPSAADQLWGGAQASASRALAGIQQRLQEAGIALPLPPPASTAQGASQAQQQQQQQPWHAQQQQQHALEAGWQQQQQQPQQPGMASSPPGVGRDDDPEVLRALLCQSRQLDALRRQNRALRAAVCRLDPACPLCGPRPSSEEWG